MQSFSKRGIPSQVIHRLLPKINFEIANILQGVTDFTVELEVDVDSNSMDIFIDYGDSKRIIELASGMEKMIASLAIRVALINVSSLPKSDIFVIDEGFGTLDSENLTSMFMLFDYLKTHYDAIQYYIPDRYTEGYGISKQGIAYAAAQNISVIIALDCGIKAIDAIAKAKS